MKIVSNIGIENKAPPLGDVMEGTLERGDASKWFQRARVA
jgi:hypothetical protein